MTFVVKEFYNKNMELNITKKEKKTLWISRIAGIIVCGLLIAFLLLYYFGNIDFNMFLLAMLGLCSIIFFVASSFLAIKSTPFWMYFSFIMAILFVLAFIVVLIVFCTNGTFQM